MAGFKHNSLIAPVVKWAGGKRQLLQEIGRLLPRDPFSAYCEPFLGGGAVLFALQPQQAIVNDLNGDLITVYETIRDHCEELIEDLKLHKNTPEYFYSTRDMDRDRIQFQSLSKIQQASRTLFLNKTCFNGLFRVNSAGEFNAPYGNYKNPNIVNEAGLRAVSQYLRGSNILFFNEEFSVTLGRLDSNFFVYLDPPYDPVSDTASFTGYNKGGFNREHQVLLKQCCDILNQRGVRFLLSNSATSFIQDLYKDYSIHIIKAKRAINAVGSKRGFVAEVLIRNYE